MCTASGDAETLTGRSRISALLALRQTRRSSPERQSERRDPKFPKKREEAHCRKDKARQSSRTSHFGLSLRRQERRRHTSTSRSRSIGKQFPQHIRQYSAILEIGNFIG